MQFSRDKWLWWLPSALRLCWCLNNVGMSLGPCIPTKLGDAGVSCHAPREKKKEATSADCRHNKKTYFFHSTIFSDGHLIPSLLIPAMLSPDQIRQVYVQKSWTVIHGCETNLVAGVLFTALLVGLLGGSDEVDRLSRGHATLLHHILYSFS